MNLFNYPCIAKNAPHRTFSGHSAHVMNVKFLSKNNIEDSYLSNRSYNSNKNELDNDRIVSVGGNDCSVMMYSVYKMPK